MTLWDQSLHFWRKRPLTDSTPAFLCQKWCVIWSEGYVATSDSLGFWGLFLASYTPNVNQPHVKTDRVVLIIKHGLNVTEPFAFSTLLLSFSLMLLRVFAPLEIFMFDMSSLWTGVPWCSAFCFSYMESTQGSQNRLWKSCLRLGRTPVLTLKQMWYLHKRPAVSMERIKY